MKTLLFGAVFVCLFASITSSRAAFGITIDAFDRGWYEDDGFHSAGIKNTWTGYTHLVPEDDFKLFNSFFSFDLAALSGTVTSGTLRLELEGYYSPDSSEAFTVFDVTTDVNTLIQSCPGLLQDPFDPCYRIYGDLQSGATYGTGVASVSDIGTVIDITLSPAALADINAASGGLFAIGVHLTEISSGLGDEGFEGLQWSSDSEPRIHQLELTVVPIPPALWLFISGLIGLIGLARRKTE